MGITQKDFGVTKDGAKVTLYTLENKNGMIVSCIDYGANVVSVITADAKGEMADVVLGFDDVAEYEVNAPFFGAFIGRHGNRIGGASFSLNGTTYELEKNDGNNNLHGGTPGYHKVMYDAAVEEGESYTAVTFTRTSADMEQGYPGTLDMTITYKLTDDNELFMVYDAKSDKDTIVNFTNHSYFNLDGEGSGSIIDHTVQLDASNFTPTSKDLIPTGEILPVAGTPLDFTSAKRVGDEIDADYEPLKFGQGYDHNFVLDKGAGVYGKIGTVTGTSGRYMDIYTDLPGVQFYSGNCISNASNGKNGHAYTVRDGMCFETQYFPNSCNIESFPSCVLKAGENFHSVTMYKFGAN
ncbi:MAG: galactose mutarotase [Lachnospiraceae bacterium]|nr:galactose mutarotase [Lachnospiraceae bacterium]